MSQRRFTRSSTLAMRNNHNRYMKSKEQADIQIKVRDAITFHKFNQALTLINSVPLENHWAKCQRARILFQMGKISRSLNAVRNALRIQRKNCSDCLILLLKIIDKNNTNLTPFYADIINCLSLEDIQLQIKNQFQLRKSLIHNKEQPNTDVSRQLRQKFKDMTSYYEKKGLMFKKVQIVQVDEQYRVARAKSTIKANQIIIFVPEEQMITLQMAKSMLQISKICKQQVKLKSPKHCILSIFLLIHMDLGQTSPYFNYIQCLPKKLNNFPINYSDELLQQLKGTSFLALIKKKKSDIQQDFKEVITILKDLKQIITYQKFVWARMIVSSRIFGVNMNDKKTDALVPIADMLNHKIPKMTSWYFSDQKKGFVVQNAEQQIPKNHQIFDSYGFKCNSRFLMNYGFTVPENAYNQMINIKKRRGSKIPCPNIKLTTNINTEDFKLLLSYYRQSTLESHENTLFDVNQSHMKAKNFLSNQNQCEAWRMILQSMKQQLQQYKTTIKIDEKLLRSSQSLSFNLQNCINIRLGEKRVLDFYVRLSRKMIQYFTRKRKNVEIKEYEAYLREIQKSLSPLGQ